MSLGSGRGLAVPSPDAHGWGRCMVNSAPAVFTLASVPYEKLSRSWEPHKWLRYERSAPRTASFGCFGRAADVRAWPHPLKVSVSGKPRPIARSASWTGPSAASTAIDERLEPGAAYAPSPAAPVSSARPLEPTPQSAGRAPP